MDDSKNPSPNNLRAPSLSSLNALGTLLIVLGLLLFNNSMAGWQITYATESGASHKETLKNLALYIIGAIFLILLGIQLLFKRRWACHFLQSIKQMSQLAMLFIPLSTIIILYNRSLMDELSTFYQELIQQIMQQESGLSEPLDTERVRRILQTSFWLLSFLGMGICALILRLSKRSLSPAVQNLLEQSSPQAGPLSQFILNIPKPFILLLILGTYGATLNLLGLILSLDQILSSLISLLSFACFALALLQLTHKDINTKKALIHCATAYGLQLLATLFIHKNQVAESNEISFKALEQVNIQITALHYFIMLLYFGWLYRKHFNSPEAGG